MNTEREDLGWALDVSHWSDNGPRVYVAIDHDGTVIDGLTYLSDEPPGRLVAIVHENGQAAVEAWCRLHADFVESLTAAPR